MSPDTATPHERFCALERAVGRTSRCTGASCAFWLDAPGVGLCLLEGSEASFEHRPDLARHLLAVRAGLEEEQLEFDEPWAELDDTGYELTGE
jgi:hypothetical protein